MKKEKTWPVLQGRVCMHCSEKISANFLKRPPADRGRGRSYGSRWVGRKEICPVCGELGDMVEVVCRE